MTRHNQNVRFFPVLLALGCGLLAAAAAASAESAYTLDLRRYFASDEAEQADRTDLLVRVANFEKQSAASLNSPQQLGRWLDSYDGLGKDLQKHDLYVYLRAEQNREDRQNAAADESLSDLISQLDVGVEDTLAQLSASDLHNWLRADPALMRYTSFVEGSLRSAAHDRQNQDAVRLLARPTLAGLSNSYKALRRRSQAGTAQNPANGKDAFEAKWTPYLNNEEAFASLLLPIVTLQNGQAELQGFASAPDAAYYRAGLPEAVVQAVIRGLTADSAYRRYQDVIASAAARRTGVPRADLHAWDLDAADSYSPPETAFSAALPTILAAEQAMGPEYAAQYQQLFDSSNHRLSLCTGEACDGTGFSVGYAGLTSGLFYGNYNGSTNSLRAVAHEAGHAVHRQFMNDNQPLGVYNRGPQFMFESVAIFNELLLLEHLYRAARSLEEKAYYLQKLLDDITFQIYGSARETDLEASIYSQAQSGQLRSAADLDALTLEVFARAMSPPALDPQMKVYWATNRLYFTDPLYDVNYLFAGLLALQYMHQYEQSPRKFSQRFVSMLKNGFTDTPQAMEQRFLGIDLGNAEALVGNATSWITQHFGTPRSVSQIGQSGRSKMTHGFYLRRRLMVLR